VLLAEKKQRLGRLPGGGCAAYCRDGILGQQRIVPGDHRVVERGVHTVALLGFGDTDSAAIRCLGAGVRQLRRAIELLLDLVYVQVPRRMVAADMCMGERRHALQQGEQHSNQHVSGTLHVA
jgi:hypothetical protein